MGPRGELGDHVHPFLQGEGGAVLHGDARVHPRLEGRVGGDDPHRDGIRRRRDGQLVGGRQVGQRVGDRRPPGSAGGMSASGTVGLDPPTTRIWSALTLPTPSSSTAPASSELTTIPPPSTSIPPVPSMPPARRRRPVEHAEHAVVGRRRPGRGRRRGLDAPGGASPSSGANAYCTSIAGVITWSAFDPSGQLAPGPRRRSAGRVQQTTSPLPSSPSVAQSTVRGQVDAVVGQQACPR